MSKMKDLHIDEINNMYKHVTDLVPCKDFCFMCLVKHYCDICPEYD